MNTTERSAIVLQQIDAALALSEKATPGPWEIDGDFIDQQDEYPVAVTRSGIFLPDVTKSGIHIHNASFIAASRTGWPTSLRCLKTAIEACLDKQSWDGSIRAMYIRQDAEEILTALCDQWEANHE